MKAFIEEFGTLIAQFIIAVALLAVLFSSTIESETIKKAVVPELMTVSAGDNGMVASMLKPTLKVTGGSVPLGGTFNVIDYILVAEDFEGNDLKEQVVVTGADLIDVNVAGEYTLYFSLTDSYGLISKAEAVITVG